ncbi:MAG: N-acetyltransferase, partial [Rhodospirillales bacterium]
MTQDNGCMAAHRGWRGEALLTAELKLRPPSKNDVFPLAKIANDEQIASWTAELPHPYNAHDAEEFVSKSAQGKAQGDEIALVIERLADGELVGAISLSIEDRQGRLGYWIGRQFWKRGYATQAARRMVRLAFQALDL